MLLPQSSAFVSLRNRLNAVNSAGFLHIAPKTYVSFLSILTPPSHSLYLLHFKLTKTRSFLIFSFFFMAEQLSRAGRKSVAGPTTSNGKISSHTFALFKSDTSGTGAVKNPPSSPSSNSNSNNISVLRNPGLMVFLVLEGHRLHPVGLSTGAVLRERRGSRQ